MFLFKGLRAFVPLEGVSSALLTCGFCSSHCLPVPCESLPSCLISEGSISAELPRGRGWGRATAGARQLPEGRCSGKFYDCLPHNGLCARMGVGVGGKRSAEKTLPIGPAYLRWQTAYMHRSRPVLTFIGPG